MLVLRGLSFIFVTYLVTADTSLQVGPYNPPQRNVTSVAPPTSSSTPVTTTLTTTHKSSTSTSPTTSSPTTPFPTTPSPTTPFPTTPSPTTLSPTTPSPTIPPTTVKPTPIPPPNPMPNTWSLNFTNTNRTCLVLKVAAQFEVPVKNDNGTKINVPSNVNVTGNCENKTSPDESLMVSWDNNSISFNFVKVQNNKFEISSINATLLWGNKTQTFYHIKPEFLVPLSNSYKCTKVQTLNLTDNTNSTISLHVSHLQYQAFRNETVPKFDLAWDCDGVNTPDIVPVVVGCVLAILIVLMLVGYIVGRRRCQSRGYLSMFLEKGNERDYIPMKTLSCFK